MLGDSVSTTVELALLNTADLDSVGLEHGDLDDSGGVDFQDFLILAQAFAPGGA